ncbi:prolyl oligopeptidase family serine peptidase [Flavobacterium sp. MAH-1]|uniref:Prolyl oligopeptidase family serine peptidase n=1 Tax=Flavobacterium agri TaxID=2743471 RepID=A0A7Y8Y202_9FLAO|nr:prolyl oligopeptidase family serine peptidase [Flavobacterium agri]NUY81013.1 prolyl oligopeptidase family serine peptidase [Flavobacterium agri]NYA71037.1 prolyl oligopeptidase family serine peptidase [Flavobacterium agri]
MRIKLPIFFLLLCSVAFAQLDIEHIPYGQDKKQTFDLYMPAKMDQSTPVFILIHGGAWVMGTNEMTEKNAKDLRDRGMVVVNVDYRTVSEKVHGKDLVADISNAVAKVRVVSRDFGFSDGGYHISGISAGAHLALMYAYTTDQPVKSITAMSAPTRLDDPQMLEVAKKFNLVLAVMLLAEAKLENTPENLEKLKKISPYAFVKNIPTQLIHGDQDDLVPISQARFLYEILQKQSADSKLLVMQGQGHDVGLRSPETEVKVLDAIEAWTKAHNSSRR